MNEYQWKLSEKELTQFQNGRPDQKIFCKQDINYKDSVIFKISVRRKASGSDKTGFDLKIKTINNNKSKISGIFSIMVKEISYIHNKDAFNNLKEGQSKGIYFFDDNLVDTLSSLSICIAVRF